MSYRPLTVARDTNSPLSETFHQSKSRVNAGVNSSGINASLDLDQLIHPSLPSAGISTIEGCSPASANLLSQHVPDDWEEATSKTEVSIHFSTPAYSIVENSCILMILPSQGQEHSGRQSRVLTISIASMSIAEHPRSRRLAVDLFCSRAKVGGRNDQRDNLRLHCQGAEVRGPQTPKVTAFSKCLAAPP